MNTEVTWMTMKNRNQHSTRKCSERAVWMLNNLLTRLNRVESAGDIPSPVIKASGAATKTVTKYAMLCSPLYAAQPVSAGQSSDRYWIITEPASGKTCQLVGIQAVPFAAREQQDVEYEAVREPEYVGAEVPPPRQPDRVAKTG